MQHMNAPARVGRKSVYSPQEISSILALMEDGYYSSVVSLCALHGISRQTYYKWQEKYGRKALLALRVDALEAEVAQLKEALQIYRNSVPFRQAWATPAQYEITAE